MRPLAYHTGWRNCINTKTLPNGSVGRNLSVASVTYRPEAVILCLGKLGRFSHVKPLYEFTFDKFPAADLLCPSRQVICTLSARY